MSERVSSFCGVWSACFEHSPCALVSIIAPMNPNMAHISGFLLAVLYFELYQNSEVLTMKNFRLSHGTK